MQASNMSQNSLLKIMVAVALFVVAALLFVAFFEQLPIEGTTLAIDWQGLWGPLHSGQSPYQSMYGFRVPPWSILPLVPLSWLSMRASWGLLVLINNLVLIASVPRIAQRRLYWLGVLLLVTSFPALRHNVDGNLEAMVIAGGVLALVGYRKQQPYVLAAGVLLAATKPQVVMLLLVVLGVYVLQTWPVRMWLKTVLVIVVVAIPSLLWGGQGWMNSMFGANSQLWTNSIIDISLTAALNRTHFVPPVMIGAIWLAILGVTLYAAWRGSRAFTGDKAGMLVAASMLLSPYAAGNSVLTVLAIGMIPVFLVRPKVGLLLVVLINFPFVWNADLLLYWQAYYWTAMLLLCWGVMLKYVLAESRVVQPVGSMVASEASV